MAIIYSGSYFGTESFEPEVSIVITGVSPDLIDDEGGDIMIATGIFPVNTPLNIYIGLSIES